MRRANLSWNRVFQFIPGLVSKGLVLEMHGGGRRAYFLTPNGNEVLRLFDAVHAELTEPSDPKVWTNGDTGQMATIGQEVRTNFRTQFQNS